MVDQAAFAAQRRNNFETSIVKEFLRRSCREVYTQRLLQKAEETLGEKRLCTWALLDEFRDFPLYFKTDVIANLPDKLPFSIMLSDKGRDYVLQLWEQAAENRPSWAADAPFALVFPWPRAKQPLALHNGPEYADCPKVKWPLSFDGSTGLVLEPFWSLFDSCEWDV